MAITVMYRTSDGELFENLGTAQTHERENKDLIEFYNNLETYNYEGRRVYIENSEAFQDEVWSIKFHNVEELDTLRSILNIEQGLDVAPYHEHKSLIYVWDEGNAYISLYDWVKHQVSEWFPNDELDKCFPY